MPAQKKKPGAGSGSSGGGGDIGAGLPPPVTITQQGGEAAGAAAESHKLPLHYGTLVSLLQEDALEVRIGQPTGSSQGSSTNSLQDAASSREESPTLLGRAEPSEGTALLSGPQRSLSSSSRHGRPKKKKWVASWFTPSFCVVALVVLNGDSARGALFPTLWPLVSSLGGDRIMQGYIVSAFSVGRLLASPYIGRLSEVYGYRPVLLVTTLLLALGTLLYASSTTIPHVLASQVVMGIGSGTLGVTRAWVAEQTERSKRTVLLAYLTAVQYAGFTVMPMAGGLLSNIFENKTLPLLGPLRADVYTAPALLMSLLCLLAAILLVVVFEEKAIHQTTTVAPAAAFPPAAAVNNNSSSNNSNMHPTRSDLNLARGLVEAQQQQQQQQQEEGQRDVEQGGERSGTATTTIDGAAVSHWWPGRQDIVIVGGILLNVATKGTIAIYETLGIQFATSHFPRMTAQDAGFLFASFGLIGVIALLYMKRLCRLFNDVQLILGGMMLMVACDLLMLGGETFPVWRFYVAIFLMYATGYPIGHTAVIGMFSKVLGKRPQGYLMGVFGSAGSLARVIFPIIGGHVAEDLGNNALFGGAAVFLGISGLLLLAAKDEVLHMSEAEH